MAVFLRRWLRLLRHVSAGLNSFCGRPDHINHQAGGREHGDMAASDLSHFSAHALRDETFQLGLHSPVLRGYDVPARLRLLRGAVDLLVE